MAPIHLLHVPSHTFKQCRMALVHFFHELSRPIQSAVHPFEQFVGSLVSSLDDFLSPFVALLDYLLASPVYFFDEMPNIPSGPSSVPNRKNPDDKPEDSCSAEDIRPNN